MSLLCASCLHELKIPDPDFGLVFQDRKDATDQHGGEGEAGAVVHRVVPCCSQSAGDRAGSCSFVAAS